MHNKFASDNIMRKCKHFVLKSLLKFINEKIKFLYNDNIGRGVVIKELKTLDQYQIANATIKFNQDFLKKTIEEIFSENISGRYSVLLIDHNKKLIKNLLNENDENKKIYFTKLFSLSFKECLNHFIEKEYVDELQGLTCFSQIKDKILKDYPEDGENYYDNLKYSFFIISSSFFSSSVLFLSWSLLILFSNNLNKYSIGLKWSLTPFPSSLIFPYI